MGARQQYRTMSRMQRRRTWAQDRMGMRQDFQPAGEEQYDAAPPAPAEPDYVAELERLAQLRDQGVITADDFDAKKRQLLGL
jgi:hypothetical protein